MTGINASVEMTGINASVEMTRVNASVEMTGLMFRKHRSFRLQWRSHGAEKSRVSRAGDLSITSPSVTSVEMTGVDVSVEMTGINASGNTGHFDRSGVATERRNFGFREHEISPLRHLR